MMAIDLMYNLALLVALSVISGFIDQRWNRSTLPGVVLQGLLFGSVAVIGMLRPLVLLPGLVFDGRSVMISLCGLFFGPVAVSVAGVMAVVCRIMQGGIGAYMGVCVIVSSALWGCVGYFWRLRQGRELSVWPFFVFGLCVHVTMLLLAFTLPFTLALGVLNRIGLPVLIAYPLATILVGKILADQVALKEKKEELDRYFSSSLDLLCIANTQGQFVRLNPEWEKVLGYQIAELEGKMFLDLVHPDDLAGTLAAVTNLKNQKEVRSFENRYRCKDGSYRWIEWRSKPHGILIYAVARDVTARKQAEEAMQKSRDDAEAASRAKTVFLTTMSHELRTPMNAIMGFTNLTLQTELTPKQRRNLDIVLSRSQDLMVLLGDILDMSKIEANRMVLGKEPFSVSRLVTDVMAMMALSAASKQLSLEKTLDPALPPVVYGDAQRLRQVLLNLLGNAVKFTKKGGIHVRVDCDPPPAPGADHVWLHVRVQDTGIGIPHDKMDEIFDVFVQADNSNTRKYEGAGLGLAIVRRLVKMMGGSAWVECPPSSRSLRSGLGQASTPQDLSLPSAALMPASEEGPGSVFHFTVHLALQADPGAEQRLPVVPGPSSASRCCRVLVVEDDEPNGLLAVQILKDAGYEAIQVFSGPAALSALAHSDFDLVLMDVKMPGMDGLEVTRQIRMSQSLIQNPKFKIKNPGIPVVALTALAMKEDETRCLEAGMNAYVSKPFDPPTLLAAIHEILNAAPHHRHMPVA